MDVFRLHVRPQGGAADAVRSFEYCKREQVLGVGWAVGLPSHNRPTWDEYVQRAGRIHGSVSGARYLHDNVHEGDLIWTRDTQGRYYLARVTGGWEYRETNEAERADIVNVVPCRIVDAGLSADVPGKIQACFRPNRTIQRIIDPTAVRFSVERWNQITGEGDEPSRSGDLFALIDDQATEDLVLMYLQINGWILIPNSRAKDTAAYEYVLVNRVSRERAVVQVKSGRTPLMPMEWTGRSERVFLFQSQGVYVGSPAPGVTTIAPSAIREFAVAHSDFLPATVTCWLP